MVMGEEYLSYKEWLRKLELFSEEKRRFKRARSREKSSV